MWSTIRERIVGDGKPRVSGHIAYRAVLKREEVPEDLWRPDVVLWAGPRTHFVHYPLRRGELYNLVAVFHSDRYEEGWNARRQHGTALAAFQGPAPRSAAHARAHRDLAHVGAVRPRAGEELVARAASRCSATPRIRCCNISRKAPAWRPRTRWCWRRRSAASPDDLPAAFKAYEQERYLRTGRVQIMARVYGDFYHARGVTAELRDLALAGRTPQQSYDGIAWLYGGP